MCAPSEEFLLDMELRHAEARVHRTEFAVSLAEDELTVAGEELVGARKELTAAVAEVEKARKALKAFREQEQARLAAMGRHPSRVF